MAGNAIVLKPDNKTALSPLYGIQMLEEAGLPKGLFQVVCGEGPDVGPTLIDNANYVMFTGSTATGRVIGERAGRNLIGCCLELGGKNPMIVLDDADFDEVVQGALFGAFGNTGQICMHIERMYLPASRYEEFKTKFVAATEDAEGRRVLRLRHGRRLAGLAGPQGPRAVARRRRRGQGCDGRDRWQGSARPRAGVLRADDPRGRHQGHAGRHRPRRSVRWSSLHRYDTVDEAVALANDTDYGLNASVWGGDVNAACQVGRRIESGNVNINDILATAFASKGTPSGGVKKSGVGARHGDQGLLKYTDVQNLAVLKKQVMGARPGQDYDKYVKSMLSGLKMMRKTRISLTQATCSERFDSPIQNPSITWIPGSSAADAAPSVTNSGE